MVKAEEELQMASEVQVNKRNQLTDEFVKGAAQILESVAAATVQLR